MTTRKKASPDPDLKRQFRETARDILHMAKVKRQFGEAVDTAGAVARAMEQAYKLGYENGSNPPTNAAAVAAPTRAPDLDFMPWTLIPPRTRSTFWSICLAALGREGHTQTPSYLQPTPTPRGTLAWQLVVPDRRTYDKSVGDGTIATLIRLGLLEATSEGTRAVLSNFGIKTWNRFCEQGGYWPDDLVEKFGAASRKRSS